MPLNTDPNTANDITLATITPADANTVTKPNPIDIVSADVHIDESLITGSADISFSVTGDVTYSPVAVTDEITNESLNRTAETLKVSVNAKLETLGAAIQTALRGIGASDSLIAELQAKLDAVVTGVNAGFSEIRTAEATQTADIVTIINTKIGAAMAEVAKVLEVAENSQIKIAALDATYNTDSEFATRVAAVNALIDQLATTDFSFLGALDEALDRLNEMLRVQVKTVSVTAVNGLYAFAFATEGWAAPAAANDYMVEVLTELDFDKQAKVSDKTATGFNLQVMSRNVHFRDQPVDCSATSVPMKVRVTHLADAPLSFTTTVLNDHGGATTSGNMGA